MPSHLYIFNNCRLIILSIDVFSNLISSSFDNILLLFITYAPLSQFDTVTATYLSIDIIEMVEDDNIDCSNQRQLIDYYGNDVLYPLVNLY